MATFRHVDVIEVLAWGQRVGAVAADPHRRAYLFEYDPAWWDSGVQLAPLMMPTRPQARASSADRIFSFLALAGDTFRGLPGLLSDSLPDKFGNQLIDAWMAGHGYRPEQVTVLDRLAYMNKRAMGALEFRPARGGLAASAAPIQLARLVEQARLAFHGQLDEGDATAAALNQLISVGTSAGGARPKAVLGWNPRSGELVSGQFDLADGFEHWLLKFDGVGKDETLGPSQQYGRIEYAYSRMAGLAGVRMNPCRLQEEGGRAHFMTRRFDRDGNDKIHVQSLCALRHMDYDLSQVHAYESLFLAARDLGLGDADLTQLFARMAFNVAARNQDDHSKNFAFLLPRDGAWMLAPAYDVTFAMDPDNQWMKVQQLGVAGKFEGITRADLLEVASRFSIAGTAAALDAVNAALEAWPMLAGEAGVGDSEIARIGALHARL
ncbi:MAG: type II toxin-antitoxin system HipA family toxin [Luteimonas sp.]